MGEQRHLVKWPWPRKLLRGHSLSCSLRHDHEGAGRWGYARVRDGLPGGSCGAVHPLNGLTVGFGALV
jgi:hypothetical protein